jgi:hypothetical protein
VDDFFQTSCPGIFAAGNVLHVHDLVDFVSIEAEELADAAADYLSGADISNANIPLVSGENIGHVIPQRVSGKRDFTLSLRVRKPIRDCEIAVTQGEITLFSKKLQKAIPAEMIQFQVPSSSIKTRDKIEVTIR